MGFIEQKVRAAEFLLSEANGQRSRENIVIAGSGKEFLPGQLLSVTAGGEYEAYAGPGDDAENPVLVAGVLYAGVPASEKKQQAVGIMRDAEVVTELLIGLDESAVQGLKNLGILAR